MENLKELMKSRKRIIIGAVLLVAMIDWSMKDWFYEKEKRKDIYIDDGRSLADMSNVSGGIDMSPRHTSSPVKEIVRTYLNATKMMLLPTAVAVGFIVVIYILVYFVFKVM